MKPGGVAPCCSGSSPKRTARVEIDKNPVTTPAANGNAIGSAGVRKCRSAALRGARKQPWLLLASGRP
jgi:hypothetical protein